MSRVFNFYQDDLNFPPILPPKHLQSAPVRSVPAQFQLSGRASRLVFVLILPSQKIFQNSKVKTFKGTKKFVKMLYLEDYLESKPLYLLQFDEIFFYELTFFKGNLILSLFQWLNTCQVNYVIDFLTCARWISLFKVSAILVCILRKLHMVSNNL